MANPISRRAANPPASSGLRHRLYVIIFETHTPAGRLFDLVLLGLIAVSVLVTMLDSLASIRESCGKWLFALEWSFTALFALEYILRTICVRRPERYVFSLLGLVDLIGWLPTVIGLLIPGTHYLTTFRIIRVLRIFRILKMVTYLQEARQLVSALRSGIRKIVVFLCAVFTLVILLGSSMYLVEGPDNGFTSIPLSIYWAIVTLTTVGYGDISPQTPLGQMLASLVMILGFSIIAVPTGIVSAEFVRGNSNSPLPACPACGKKDHQADARFCRHCGSELSLKPGSSNRRSRAQTGES